MRSADDVFAVLARSGVDLVGSDRAERLLQQGLRLGLVDVKRFDRQAAGQLFELAETLSGGIRAAVNEADSFDIVQLSVGDLIGGDAELGGGQFPVLVGVDGAPSTGHDVHFRHVLQNPAALRQLKICVLAGKALRAWTR